MKVTFKLTPAQLSRARAIFTKVQEQEEIEGDVWAGNLRGWVTNHPCFNQDQDLSLVNGMLVYTGQRHPMHNDFVMHAIRDIAEGDWTWVRWIKDFAWTSLLQVVAYETTDKRLQWFETARQYVVEKGTWHDYVKHVADHGGHSKEHERCFPELHAAVTAIRSGKSDRVLSASFSTDIIKGARLMAAQYYDSRKDA